MMPEISAFEGRLRRGRLRAQAFPGPGHNFVDPPDRVVGQARQNVGEPGLRIDIIELAGLCRPPNYAEWFWKERRCRAVSARRGVSPRSHSA
jgi:hypothetical protein